MKRNRKQIKFEKYKHILARHLVEAKLKSRNDELYISLDALRIECGQYQKNNKRRWVYDIFKDEVPFFHVITTGNNITKKLSLIRLDQGNLPTILDLMEAQEQEVIYSIQFAGMTQEEIEDLPRIPLDCRSLDNYICSTRSQLKNPAKKPMHESMRRYLAEAEKLQKLIKALKHFAFNLMYTRLP